MGKKFVPRPPKLLSHNDCQGNHKQSPGTINKSIIKFPKIEITQPFSSRKSPEPFVCPCCMSGPCSTFTSTCVGPFICRHRHEASSQRNSNASECFYCPTVIRLGLRASVQRTRCSYNMFAGDRSMLNERVMSNVHPVAG